MTNNSDFNLFNVSISWLVVFLPIHAKKDADLLDKVRTLMNDEHIRKLHDTLNEIQDDLDELISQDYIENHD